MFKKKSKVFTPEQIEEIRTKDFFDMILPGTVKFLSDHYILGDSYRCVWAIREYPPSAEEQAILSQLADRSGVTLRIYHRLVESMEQRKIIQNATRRNKLKSGGTDVNETIEAEGNLQDVVELLANLRKNREPLLHCSVFIELKAKSMDGLKELQSDIAMELTRSKISVDRLTLRQKEGFLSVLPVGANQFGAQYERVLPASSVANLYPFNFSGKTDPQGLYIGRDKFGTNILPELLVSTDIDFLYRMDLPHRAVSVYIYLFDRANKNGVCWPAIPTISRELKLSQSTIRRALKDLRKAGLLETEQRYRERGGKSSLLYKIRKR